MTVTEKLKNKKLVLAKSGSIVSTNRNGNFVEKKKRDMITPEGRGGEPYL